MEENKAWEASWIWAERDRGKRADGNELVYFRKTFRLADASAVRLIADVSADSRYRLYVNGVSASTGPARGDPRTHYYETIDLSPFLRDGLNALAVKVLHYKEGEPRPSAIPSAYTGALLFQGRVTDPRGQELLRLDTDDSWLFRADDAIEFLPESYTCVGGGESVEGVRLPHGWQETEFDDRDWKRAVIIAQTHLEHDGFLTPWQLTARTIPPMFERDRAFVSVTREEVSPGAVMREVSSEREWLRLPAHGKAVVELDAGELTTGYLRMEMAGGRGSEIRFLCSEGYESKDGVKGVRDQAEGNVLRGYLERYAVAGRTAAGEESYETFLFRTFRFIRFEVEAGGEPLVIHRAYYRETGYPLEVRASFEASDSSLGPLWDVSVRTLQRCMHEGYYDCPFYEQLQYSMDTRLQAMFTYAISGDDRLARKAIYEFHSSLLPGGMLLSRYPSIQPQVIPGFALYWIMMLYDHLLYYGDAEHAARYRPTVDAVLDWFARRIGGDGLVGAAPRGYWSYVDWVKEWERTRGVPSSDGPLTVYNLMYADALEKAAFINEATGRPETAREYRGRAKEILAAVNARCRSEERGLYRDGPELESYSQHSQIWAILSGAASGTEASELAERLMENSSLPQVSYSMAFFLFRALSAAGRYDLSFSLWERWREQIGLHLTTWLEDPVSQRSDCHAWGAVPLYEFTSEILGVKPNGIGYERIRIEPRPGPLRWARGQAATPRGPVEVAWRVSEDEFRLEVSGLRGRAADVRLPDGTDRRVEGKDGAEFACRMPGSSG